VFEKLKGEKITTREDIYHLKRNKKDSLIVLFAFPGHIIPFFPSLFNWFTMKFPSLIPSVFLNPIKFERLMTVVTDRRACLAPKILNNIAGRVDRVSKANPDDREIKYAGKLWNMMVSPMFVNRPSQITKYKDDSKKVVLTDLIPLMPLFRSKGYSLAAAPTSHVYLASRYLGFNPLFMRTKMIRWADWTMKDAQVFAIISN
jgi:hypothetical protein